MSKFYGYDEAMENDIAKITTPKLALMSESLHLTRSLFAWRTVPLLLSQEF